MLYFLRESRTVVNSNSVASCKNFRLRKFMLLNDTWLEQTGLKWLCALSSFLPVAMENYDSSYNMPWPIDEPSTNVNYHGGYSGYSHNEVEWTNFDSSLMGQSTVEYVFPTRSSLNTQLTFKKAQLVSLFLTMVSPMSVEILRPTRCRESPLPWSLSELDEVLWLTKGSQWTRHLCIGMESQEQGQLCSSVGGH